MNLMINSQFLKNIMCLLLGYKCSFCGFRSRSYRKIENHWNIFPKCYYDMQDKQQVKPGVEHE